MKRRKHISWKTRCASATLAFIDATDRRGVGYSDAKLMTEDQFLSLFHWDHNILHETGHEDADKFWNLAPMLIKAHREKTKADAKIIAKGRRIRAKSETVVLTDGLGRWVRIPRPVRQASKLQSRGFDKSRRRKMDGTIIKRER